MSNNATNTRKQMTWASNSVMSEQCFFSRLTSNACDNLHRCNGSFTLPSAWGAGETNATTVTASLLAGNDTSTDAVMDSPPETVALDWQNISCSIYKVTSPMTAATLRGCPKCIVVLLLWCLVAHAKSVSGKSACCQNARQRCCICYCSCLPVAPGLRASPQQLAYQSMTLMSSMSKHASLTYHNGSGFLFRAVGVQLHVDQTVGLTPTPYWSGKSCSHDSRFPRSLSFSFCRLAVKGYEC